jgi:hypothetical protein
MNKRAIRRIHDEVRRILWEEWDPIGVRDLGGPDDEYDSYAGVVARYVVEGRDEFAISQLLAQLELNSMGLSSCDAANNRRVARLLLALREVGSLPR